VPTLGCSRIPLRLKRCAGFQTFAAFFSATAFMQYRNPLGAGPSGNTMPKVASQVLQTVSTRFRNAGPSKRYAMTFAATACVNDGQPIPDSNFSEASKSTVSQAEAGIDSRLKQAAHLRTEGPFGACPAGYEILLIAQSLAPLGIRFDDHRSGAGLPFLARFRMSGHFGSMVSFSAIERPRAARLDSQCSMFLAGQCPTLQPRSPRQIAS